MIAMGVITRASPHTMTQNFNQLNEKKPLNLWHFDNEVGLVLTSSNNDRLKGFYFW